MKTVRKKNHLELFTILFTDTFQYRCATGLWRKKRQFCRILWTHARFKMADIAGRQLLVISYLKAAPMLGDIVETVMLKGGQLFVFARVSAPVLPRENQCCQSEKIVVFQLFSIFGFSLYQVLFKRKLFMIMVFFNILTLVLRLAVMKAFQRDGGNPIAYWHVPDYCYDVAGGRVVSR